MPYFAYSGKKKIPIHLQNNQNVVFLRPRHALSGASSSLHESLKLFFQVNSKRFAGNKVCIVLPDNTRDFYAAKTVRPLAGHLRRLSQEVDSIIALGLHRRLGKKELTGFLGKGFIKEQNVLQHSPDQVTSLGRINGVPATLNRRLFSYDIIFTVGVVEPHLYAGFSGGVKGIAIGLAGEKTILHTHSVDYLSRKGVSVSNIRANPFQKFLWEVSNKLERPVYSLNIVNNLNKEIAFYSLGRAKKSFHDAVRYARKIYSCPVNQPVRAYGSYP
ncbi:MAG: lactate racemase domain-containing protein [bacterium]